MNSQKNEHRHWQMTNESIGKLTLRLAAPSAAGMAVIALYSLADAFFVSKLGTEAGAAVGVCFAIQALLQAVGYTLGLGAGSLMSQALGRRNTNEAATYARISFWCSIALGILIGGIGLAFTAPLMRMLGADESILPYAVSYSRYLFLASPLMCGVFVLSQLLRAEGCAVYSMVGLVSGSALNILLDPILITRLGMGVSGASAATCISQAVSLVVLLSAYLSGHSRLSLLQKGERLSFGVIPRILLLGLPSTLRQGLTVLATVLLNHAAGAWSAAALTAISIVTRLFLLAFSFCLGVGQGMMPIAGYNFGHGNLGRVRRSYFFAIGISCGGMLLLGILLMSFAPSLIAFFRNDPDVIAIGAPALRAQGLVLVLHGLITCTILLAQAIGKPIRASILAGARQGFLFVPTLLLLTRALGVGSIILVQPIADALTFLLSIPFAVSLVRSLKQKKSAVHHA